MATVNSKIAGVIFAVLALVAFAVFYFGNRQQVATAPFANSQVLQNIWQNYKKNFVASDGRTIDKNSSQGQDITTSEGQSYSMLRAVFLGDKDEFDSVWNWTEKNLKQQNGNLFSWLYGKLPNGGDGILTAKNGQNTASDADEDIALSLVFAYARWHETAYLDSARNVISDIWNQEVVMVKGQPYLTADNLEKNSPNPIINPSYLSPASYRIFAQVDRNPQHDWGKVADSSYQVINQSIYQPLDKTKSANLPPDWVKIDRATGKIDATGESNFDTNYGFDAIRVPWRLALDQQWFGDPRDNEALYRMSFLADQWKKNGVIYSIYAHDGQPLQQTEWPSTYGGSLGYFIVADPALAKQIYTQKLLSLYDSNTNGWAKQLSYYDDNWAWFGIALYSGQLPNLAKATTF